MPAARSPLILALARAQNLLNRKLVPHGLQILHDTHVIRPFTR